MIFKQSVFAIVTSVLLSVGLSLSVPAKAAQEFSRIEGRYEISKDWGGSLSEYYEKYTDLRKSEAKIKIDGMCVSACTLVLGLVPADRVCVTRYAIFGFHSAWFMGPYGPTYSSVGTNLLFMIYPKFVKEKLKALGFDGPSEHPDLVFIPGHELYEACSDS